MPMRATTLYGLLLIAVGISGYILSDRASATALIPAAIGVLIIAATMVSTHSRYHVLALYTGSLVALGGILLPYRGVLAFFRMLFSADFRFSLIVLVQSTMAALCVACVIAFLIQLAARHLRRPDPTRAS